MCFMSWRRAFGVLCCCLLEDGFLVVRVEDGRIARPLNIRYKASLIDVGRLSILIRTS
jgi:hypothetical protein